MSVYLPNGSTIHIASGYGAEKDMTAVTNATEAVATFEASHGVVEGDFIEVTSGWSRLNNRIIRAGTVSTNDVNLEGFNTTSTTLFPAGSGTGTIREITGFTQLLQVMQPQGDGGEQQFTTYQFLESDSESRIPSNKSASGLTLQVADDDSLAGYILAKAANDDRDPRAVKIVKANGGLILFSAYISLAPMPNLTINQVATVQVTFSLLNPEPTKYAS